MNVELSILAGNTAETAYSYADEWMAGIPDDALLSSVNIPATHDTGTAGVVEDAIPGVSITSCQNLYYDEQLNMGARSFDIRGNATKDDASAADVKIVHGGELWQCQEKDGSDLTLQSILNTSLGFLEKHKSETVILTVKPDAGSTVGLEHAVAEFIKSNEEKVYCGGDIPSMKEARGKIVFLRRFNLTQNYEGWVERAMGFNLTNWDDISYKNYEYAYKLYDDGKNHVYIQDA
ncbi:MAG: phosphatidylinositol-specific phospholipase C domain-containing protein, partial [Dorea formicigenerans]